MTDTREILKRAKEAERKMRTATPAQIKEALLLIADAIEDGMDRILAANLSDVEAADGVISTVMIDRLRLDKMRVAAMADGVRRVAALPCPVGRLIDSRVRPNGLKIDKVSVPIGVIAIIYESRPNVTSDAAALALGSGNAVILRGGKEAYRSARAVVDAIRSGLEKSSLPCDAVQLVEDTARASATVLMEAVGYVDLLIPRGGAELIRACVEKAKVPVLETGSGICHVYIDKHADLGKAVNILDNAKTSRPSVCNACEVCLVHRDVAQRVLPLIKERLVTDRIKGGLIPVELRLCEAAAEIIDGVSAEAVDYDTEFLDYILAIKVVDRVDDAIEHIAAHSTRHSEAIVTEDEATAELFAASVDSACVYINASTRFTDGGEFGLGCEMGIATCKIHARGPMGLGELTTYKYKISGNGQVR